MRRDYDETEGRRPLGTQLVTSWVLAAMMLILAAFIAQFPLSSDAQPVEIATR
jgi:hypothetical protein